MASYNYYIREDSKTNPTPILSRFKLTQRNDLRVKTGLFVKKEDWSNSKQKVKLRADNAEFAEQTNAQLDDLKSYVFSLYNKDYANGETINKQWLENAFKSALNQPIDQDQKRYYLQHYAEWFIENSKNRRNKRTKKRISIRTIQDYSTTVRYIELFQTSEGLPKIKLTDFNREMYYNFIAFLEEKLQLSENTIGGHISNLKIFLKNAERENFNVCEDYKSGDFLEPQNETIDTYLSEDEINSIYRYEFKNDRLDNARDWLIVGLWTGFRVSDLLNLNPKEHIKEGFFEKVNYKTGITTVIPIHVQVRAILKKRNGEFPRKISDQKFNDYIKQVCMIVGINERIDGAKKMTVEIPYKDKKGKDIIIKRQRKVRGKFPKYELISSHSCRRSFASNHYGKIDTLTLMNCTGHSSERQFLEYVKITPKEHAEKLKELWKKLSQAA